jgi:dTDP-glucose pyrophosphorylase
VATIALVLTAAGVGRRLAPLTDVLPKAFLPVAIDQYGQTETVLSRLLRQGRDAQLSQAWIAGTSHPWFGHIGERDKDVRVVMAQPGGEWLAVTACIEAGLPTGPLVVISSDNVFDDRDMAGFVEAARVTPESCLVAAAPADDTTALTVLDTADDHVTGLVEKPSDGRPGLAKSGLYYFSQQGLRAALTGPHRRDRFGEYSMTEVLLGLVDADVGVSAYRLAHGFHDVGTVAGLGRAIRAASGPR